LILYIKLKNMFCVETMNLVEHQSCIKFCVELGKSPVQTRDLLKQTKCGRTILAALRASVYPGTNDLQISFK
jgi:hypothetical protein